MDRPERGAEPVADATPHPHVGLPDKIGRYRVERMIGAGGMGIVMAAYDERLDRRVAIKLLRGRRDDGEARHRLLREAQALARLSHPNVVAIYEAGVADEQVYLAMEFVAGVTLRAWLQERTRTVDEIREIFLQAGRGLAAAHAVGLIHRDFKPK